MTIQLINIGSTANDRTGDPLRTAFTKLNANLTELYNFKNGVYNVPVGTTLVLNDPQDSTPELPGALHILGGATILKSLNVGDMIHIGAGADTIPYLNPVFIGKRSGTTYVQGIIINSDGHGSADLVCQADNGDETQGWIDMGITGSVYDDPNYSITERGEGYIFMQGVDDGVGHGSLILATGDKGLFGDIGFATGGFTEAHERMRILNNEQQLKIWMTTESTSVSTGALSVDGGVGIAGKLYIGGGVHFTDGTSQLSAAISKSDLKTLVAASTSFADFQSRIAAL